jgi:hypothetical protein
MVMMWCYHRRLVDVYRVTPYISELRHADGTRCTGRNPKRD